MWPLLANGVLTFLGAALYLSIGASFVRRRLEQGDRPLSYFATFWLGIGTYGAVEGLWWVWMALAPPPVAVGITVLYLKVLAGVAGFFGIVAYVLSIYLGRDPLLPLALLYGGIYLLVLYFYAWQNPIGQKIGTWSAGLVYEHAHGAFWNVVVVALFVPPLLAALSYAFLLRAAPDPATRRRVLIVSLSLATFFGGVFLNWLTAAFPSWPFLEKSLAIGAAFAVLRVVTPLPARRPLADSVTP